MVRTEYLPHSTVKRCVLMSLDFHSEDTKDFYRRWFQQNFRDTEELCIDNFDGRLARVYPTTVTPMLCRTWAYLPRIKWDRGPVVKTQNLGEATMSIYPMNLYTSSSLRGFLRLFWHTIAGLIFFGNSNPVLEKLAKLVSEGVELVPLLVR